MNIKHISQKTKSAAFGLLYALLLGGMGGGLFVSCLDLYPKDSLGDNLAWSKAENYRLFANQFYGWTHDLAGSNYQSILAESGGNTSSGSVHSDYRSDLVCAAAINAYSQGSNAIPASDGNFTTLYTRIFYTNLLLKHAESFGNQQAIANAVGEAYWFRAYLHFELVQIYGDVQILTEPLDISNNQLYGERNSRTQVIDRVIEDLQKAEELLPEKATEEGRLCKAAANAMLSRVALYEGTWQKFHDGNGSNTELSTRYLTIARDAAKKVFGKYTLFYNKDLVNTASNTIGAKNQSYRYLFILENADCNPAKLQKAANTEYILARRHRDTDRLGINLTQAFDGNACYVTAKMANMYLCQDGLPISKSPLFRGYSNPADEFVNRDTRMDNSLLYNGEIHWNNDGKWRTTWTDADEASSLVANTRSNSGYLTQKWAVERQVADFYETVDFPIIRYAEVLLNYAEACYELQDRIDDADLDASLNLVRLRSNPDMPKLSNAFVAGHGLDIREEIRRERTVELFLEGFRIDDLKRWKTAETEMPQDQLGVLVTGTWYGSNWSNQSRALNTAGRIVMFNGRTWSEKNYLYPLPSDQLQLNKNLTQNPGWK